MKIRLLKAKDICDLRSDETLPRLLFYDQSSNKSPSAAKLSKNILRTQFKKTLRTDIIVSFHMAIGFCENIDHNTH